MARKDMLRKMKKPSAPMEDELLLDEEDEELPLEEDMELEDEEMEEAPDEAMLEEYRAVLEEAGYTVMAPDEDLELEDEEEDMEYA